MLYVIARKSRCTMLFLDLESLEPERIVCQGKLPPVLTEIYGSKGPEDPTFEVDKFCLEQDPDDQNPMLDVARTLDRIVMTVHGQARVFFSLCDTIYIH